MTTYELLRENEWTSDGRRIVGPVLLPDKVIPLMERDPDQEYTSRLVGKVVNVRREGNRIVGDVDMDLPEDTALTADVDYAHKQNRVLEDGRIEMHNVRLRAAHVGTRDTYLWKEDEDG